jgi:hypothetical protein
LIIQSFFFAEETVKAKWKNLRDAYIRHKKLTKGTTAQATKRYKNWPWAPPHEVFGLNIGSQIVRLKYSQPAG